MDVIAVKSRKHFRDFLQVPFHLHKSDPNWVPPLYMVMKNTFDKNNPFFKNALLQSWVAYKQGKPVGRISGIINKAHNDFHHDTVGFWGFFESDNCSETTAALFKHVEEWAHQQGMTELRGPMNPSTNHECGLQISAFHTKPYIMMTQNPAYYAELVEQQGYSKARDLLAWLIDNEEIKVNPKLLQKIDALQQKENIRVRTLDMRRYDEEVETIFAIYNEAWEKNWGFFPLSVEEYRHMAKDFKSLLIPELIYILEVAGEPAAFSLWLPDINQALVHIRNGKLFPTGLLKLLWHTKVKKTITQGRIPILGIKQKFQHMPLGMMLYLNYFHKAPKLGYQAVECSWVLEENRSMLAALRLLKANHYKTYRIYEKKLQAIALECQ